MSPTATKEHAHELIERIAPAHVPALVEILEQMLHPTTPAVAHIPFEDEEISEEEEQSVARAKAETGPTTSMEDLMAELGFTAQDLDRLDETPLSAGSKHA